MHVACPGKFGGQGIDHEGAADDADVVAGAGTEEEAVVAEGHRAGVAVAGEVVDEKGVHGKWGGGDEQAERGRSEGKDQGAKRGRALVRCGRER